MATALILALALIAAVGLASFPAAAAPHAQDLPTPTLFPAEDTPYTLDVVGGQDETLTFPGAELDGFTIGETAVSSQYPRGMTFAVSAASDGGEIQEAILFVRFLHGSGTRFAAEYDSESEQWIARPWERGDEQPAWTHFNFYWRVRDSSGASVDTEPQTVDYWDPGREWFRVESEHVILYWTGFGEDDPDTIAQTLADRVAASYPRIVAGFGRALSYKPVSVVYPNREALAETSGAGVERNRVAGFTSDSLGMIVQILRDTSIPPGNENCIWMTKPEDWTMERRINTIYAVTVHEMVHLFQYDIQGGPRGPEWYTEGQPEWFSNTSRNYDERLRMLGTLQDIPSLTTNIGSDLTQADGCYALSYNVGPSFLNFVFTNYGGVDVHLRIVELMRSENASVYAALEQITGKTFLELENEWRVYLGMAPLALADIDPASALEPAIDPIAEVGETVTLPASPPLPAVYEKPGPNSLYSGQCFANTQVEILQIGSLDGVDYYQVNCMGQIGWMSRDQLVGPGQ
ncbi:MAG: hypothetical protein GXY36_13285 [Chloroflexi bacterium]|nr:hypothetical protein [Chloroflexota bacterium]